MTKRRAWAKPKFYTGATYYGIRQFTIEKQDLHFASVHEAGIELQLAWFMPDDVIRETNANTAIDWKHFIKLNNFSHLMIWTNLVKFQNSATN